MQTTEKPSFMEGAMKLKRVLDRFIRKHERQVCERCALEPCVCGDPEFEAEVSRELDAAADREVL